LVSAADYTGHVTPIAFMSIVGNNLLQQAVFNVGLPKPFLILNNVKQEYFQDASPILRNIHCKRWNGYRLIQY
jgi:hypothetical protein